METERRRKQEANQALMQNIQSQIEMAKQRREQDLMQQRAYVSTSGGPHLTDSETLDLNDLLKKQNQINKLQVLQ